MCTTWDSINIALCACKNGWKSHIWSCCFWPPDGQHREGQENPSEHQKICLKKKNNGYFEGQFWGVQDKTPGSTWIVGHFCATSSAPTRQTPAEGVVVTGGMGSCSPVTWENLEQPHREPWPSEGSWEILLWVVSWFIFPQRILKTLQAAPARLDDLRAFFNSHCTAGETIKKCIE